MDDSAEIRRRIANAVRFHQLIDGRCEACGVQATHQSLHQADVIIGRAGLSISLT